jgi:two-component system NarL family sensor kinase
MCCCRVTEPRFGSIRRRLWGLQVDVWRQTPGGLESGDVILAIDGHTLSDWLADIWQQPLKRASATLDYQILRAGQTEHVQVQLGPYSLAGALGERRAMEAAQLYLWVVSAVVFALRPGQAGARALFLVSSAIVSSSTVFFLGLQASDLRQALLVGLWLWGSVALFGLAMAGMLHFSLVFPVGRTALERRPWLLALVYAGPWAPYLMGLALAWPQTNTATARLGLLLRSTDLITLAYFPLVLLGALTTYRRAKTQTERRQLRWVVWGLYVAIAPWVALNVIPAMFGLPALLPPIVSGMLWCAVPVAIAIAILRERLFDIDVIIRRTLIYSLLSVALALVYFASVVLLQNLFEALTGERRSALVTVLSTLAIAALFGPLRQRVQAVIDRQFYRRKYDSARLLSAFGAKLREDASADLRHLTDQLLAAVDESMQPEHATLWLRAQPGAAAENAALLPHYLTEIQQVCRNIRQSL